MAISATFNFKMNLINCDAKFYCGACGNDLIALRKLCEILLRCGNDAEIYCDAEMMRKLLASGIFFYHAKIMLNLITFRK